MRTSLTSQQIHMKLIHLLLITSLAVVAVAEIRSTYDLGRMWKLGRFKLDISVTDPPSAAFEHKISIHLKLREQSLWTEPAPWSETHGNFGHFEFSAVKPNNVKTLDIELKQTKTLSADVIATGSLTIPLKDGKFEGELSPSGKVVIEMTFVPREEGGYIAPDDHDVTSSFLSYYSTWSKDAASFLTRYPESNKYSYVFVKGFGCNLVPGYFSSNYKVLDDIGLYHETVEMNTQGGCFENALKIRNTILNIHKARQQPVILIAQSKGGSDIATSLVSYWDELEDVVSGIVSFNGVFGGTPVVDLLNSTHLTPEAEWILEHILGGNKSSLECMGVKRRNDFYDSYGYPADNVPTVALTSYSLFENNTVGEDVWKVYFGIIGGILRNDYGWLNDGVVSPVDERFPGGATVLLTSMCHAESAVNLIGDLWKVEPLTGACLELLFDEMRH